MKKFHIKCRESGLESFVEAPDITHAANAFASKYFQSFYPPFLTESGKWCVCSSTCERYFSVSEVG